MKFGIFRNIITLIVIVVILTVSNPVYAQLSAGLAQQPAAADQPISELPYYLLIVLVVGYAVLSFFRKEDDGLDADM